MKRFVCVFACVFMLCTCSVFAFAAPASIDSVPVAGFPSGAGNSPAVGMSAGWFGGVIPVSASFSALGYSRSETDDYITVIYEIGFDEEIAAGSPICDIPISNDVSSVVVMASTSVISGNIVSGSEWMQVLSGDYVSYRDGFAQLYPMNYGDAESVSEYYNFIVDGNARAIRFLAVENGSRFYVRVRYSVRVMGHPDADWGQRVLLPFQYIFKNVYDYLANIASIDVVADVIALGISGILIGISLKMIL